MKARSSIYRISPGVFISLILLNFLLLLVNGCVPALGGTAPVVRIGLVAPFEGRQRDIGYDVI
jgi:hypothetical protein